MTTGRNDGWGGYVPDAATRAAMKQAAGDFIREEQLTCDPDALVNRVIESLQQVAGDEYHRTRPRATRRDKQLRKRFDNPHWREFADELIWQASWSSVDCADLMLELRATNRAEQEFPDLRGDVIEATRTALEDRSYPADAQVIFDCVIDGLPDAWRRTPALKPKEKETVAGCTTPAQRLYMCESFRRIASFKNTFDKWWREYGSGFAAEHMPDIVRNKADADAQLEAARFDAWWQEHRADIGA